jgi:hypothetical protein
MVFITALPVVMPAPQNLDADAGGIDFMHKE